MRKHPDDWKRRTDLRTVFPHASRHDVDAALHVTAATVPDRGYSVVCLFEEYGLTQAELEAHA